MRQFDMTPLYKNTIGFDRFATLFDDVAGYASDATTYPPYNIERLGKNDYRVTMAVAGFSRDEIGIEVNEGVLSVTGGKAEDGTERAFLHQGIATRQFARRFQLADHVEVSGAALENGLLHVDLKRELPEAMKPRRIEIGTAAHAAPELTDDRTAEKAAA